MARGIRRARLLQCALRLPPAPPMPSTIRLSLLALGLLLALGCAALPPAKREPRDPWERMNRASYRFNDKFDRAIFQPAARRARTVTPRAALRRLGQVPVAHHPRAVGVARADAGPRAHVLRRRRLRRGPRRRA